jgi:hypothetical protein
MPEAARLGWVIVHVPDVEAAFRHAIAALP